MQYMRRIFFWCLSIALSLLSFSAYLLKADGAWRYPTSRTFAYIHPCYQNNFATNFVWDNMIASKRGSFKSALRVLPLYQTSLYQQKNGAYFLLNCQSTIRVAGDNSADALARDVRAEWLGLPSAFSGTFSLCPHQRQVGALFSFNQDLGHIVSLPWFKRLWFTCSMPLISTAQSLHPQEAHDVAGYAPDAILQALNSPQYLYGHIFTGSCSRTGPTELDIGFGTMWEGQNGFILWYQSTLNIPLMGRTKVGYLFSPTAGLNGHVVWQNEFTGAVPLTCSEASYRCQFVVHLTNYYYFSRNQYRIFDLYQKPWSRYLPLRSKDNPDLIVPAINILTQYVKVHPHNMVNLSTGLRTSICGFSAECGYGLWCHRGERVQFLQPACATSKPLITQFGIAAATAGTASTSTITTAGPQDTVPQYLYLNDVGLYSGATPSTFTQSFYLQGGYETEDRLLCAFGLWAEHAHQKSTVDVIGVWGTLGFQF